MDDHELQSSEYNDVLRLESPNGPCNGACQRPAHRDDEPSDASGWSWIGELLQPAFYCKQREPWVRVTVTLAVVAVVAVVVLLVLG